MLAQPLATPGDALTQATPNLDLPYILSAQAQKHATHNEAIRSLDALVQLSVLDRDREAPPSLVADGDRFIVARGATGAWSGHDGNIAAWQDQSWLFRVPREGWIAWLADEDRLVVFDGTAWIAAVGSTPLNPAPLIGVNATADTTNRLAVSAPATLLNHEGAGHQLKVNKAAISQTGTLLFQTGFSGRAEMGLAGDDDFRVKVSADGATWRDALVVDRSTGVPRFPAGGVVATTSTTVTVRVPEDVSTIQAALDALLAYRFIGTAQGIVDIAPGTYTLSSALRCRHPQSFAVLIKGRTAATLPTKSSFSGTKSADEAVLRSRWPVAIECPGLRLITVDPACSGLTMQDILAVQPSGSLPAIEVRNTAVLNLSRVALHGFSVGVNIASGGFLIDSNCVYTWAGSHSILASAADVRSNAALSMRPATSHAYAEAGARVDLTGLVGVGSIIGVQLYTTTYKVFAPELSNASGYAFLATSGSAGLAYNIAVIGSGAAQNVLVTNMSFMQQVGPHTGSPVFSPAIGATGNNQSLVI